MPAEIIPAYNVPLSEQAKVFTNAFANYVAGSFQMDAAALARFILHQGADLVYSCLARGSDEFVGIAYVSRTGDVARLAGMGVVPEARRAGIGRLLLQHVIDEARARHDKVLMLEVIVQNPAAHQLYQTAGFRQVAHLLSWRSGQRKAIQNQPDRLTEISLTTASQLPGALEFPDLPWQISRHAIAKLSSGRAFQLENSIVVIGDPEVSPVRIHSLMSVSETMNWDGIRTALGRVLDCFPDCEFFAPPLFPEEFGEKVFHPLGFTQDSLSQFLMRYDISPTK